MHGALFGGGAQGDPARDGPLSACLIGAGLSSGGRGERSCRRREGLRYDDAGVSRRMNMFFLFPCQANGWRGICETSHFAMVAVAVAVPMKRAEDCEDILSRPTVSLSAGSVWCGLGVAVIISCPPFMHAKTSVFFSSSISSIAPNMPLGTPGISISHISQGAVGSRRPCA